jgi:hypothetical protein
MDDLATGTAEATSAQGVLQGGPATIPTEARIREVGPLETTIKLSHYGGYEHFERTASLAQDTARRQVIYRWTMRTDVAE